MNFTATKWDTAEAKEKWYKSFIRFLESDCSESRFTKPIYKRLSNMFGHIANFDKGGFYSTWFSTAQQRYAFTQNILQHRSYGEPAWTWSDVERAIQTWVNEHPQLKERYQRSAKCSQDGEDIRIIRNILQRHDSKFMERVNTQ